MNKDSKIVDTLIEIDKQMKTKKVSKECIRCLDIEHDIMILENQIKNLTQKRDELVKELKSLKEQEKVGKEYESLCSN